MFIIESPLQKNPNFVDIAYHVNGRPEELDLFRQYILSLALGKLAAGRQLANTALGQQTRFLLQSLHKSRIENSEAGFFHQLLTDAEVITNYSKTKLIQAGIDRRLSTDAIDKEFTLLQRGAGLDLNWITPEGYYADVQQDKQHSVMLVPSVNDFEPPERAVTIHDENYLAEANEALRVQGGEQLGFVLQHDLRPQTHGRLDISRHPTAAVYGRLNVQNQFEPAVRVASAESEYC